MKLSKSLLSAMAIGITLSATSCSLGDVEEHYDYCAEDCQVDHADTRSSADDTHIWDNCPACGMG